MFAVQALEQSIDDASFRPAGYQRRIDALQFRLVDKREVGWPQRAKRKGIRQRRKARAKRDIWKGVASSGTNGHGELRGVRVKGLKSDKVEESWYGVFSNATSR